MLVDVPSSLIKRRKTHFHNMPCGATLILGNNGYIWIGPISSHNDNTSESVSSGGGFVQNFEVYCQADETVYLLYSSTNGLCEMPDGITAEMKKDGSNAVTHSQCRNAAGVISVARQQFLG